MLRNFSKTSMNKENTTLNILKENYNNFKNDEPNIFLQKNHSISFIEVRKNMLNWIIFLCEKLNFHTETLFRSVTIFDLYMSRRDENYSQNELNLITIACLSLSTKIEEINCNYISFLNEKVLNTPNEHIFSNKDLTRMEFKILKELNFKIIYSTPFDFLETYIAVFSNILNQKKYSNNNIFPKCLISKIKTLTIDLIKNNIVNEIFMINSYSNFAYICFIQVVTRINKIITLEFNKIIFGFNCNYVNENDKNEKNNIPVNILALRSL